MMADWMGSQAGKLRVGFDARWYNDSGVGTYVSSLLQAMAALPGEVELVVYENPRNPVPELQGAALRELLFTRRSIRSPKVLSFVAVSVKTTSRYFTVPFIACRTAWLARRL